MIYLINVAQPFSNIIKRFAACDVVHKHDSHGTTVVRSGNSMEALLTGSVPVLTLWILRYLNKQQTRW